MRILITGATGLLGSHVAERLRTAGADVVALVRNRSDTRHLESIGVELRRGDLTRPESLRSAVRGCTGLVHSAAIIVAGVPWDEYRRVNARATADLLRAAAAAGVARAVHISSVAVYGGAEVAHRAPVDEDDPLDIEQAEGEFYARSKRQADAIAREFQRRGDLEVAVLRPALLYGERDRVVIPRLMKLFKLPVVPLVGRGEAELPLAYAGNAADAVRLALEHSRAAGGTFNLASDFPITQRRLFSLLAWELGRRRLFAPIPRALLAGLARTLEATTGLFTDRPPFLNRRNVSFMGAGNPFDSSRARDLLGWEPRVPHEEAVARSVRWFLSRSNLRGSTP